MANKKFLLLIVLSAIIFTGLIGAIFLFKIPMVSAVDYYTSGTPFVALWNTSKNESGTTNSTQIGLPLENGGEYNFTVYWGDGTSDTITAYDQAEVNHTYETEGIKTITINGSIKGFRFNNKLDKLKLINISSWGDLRVGNNGSYFKGCYYMNFTGSDNLNTTDMTKFSSMFYNCSKFNGNISNWDTSSITAMDYMFRNADVFNSSIANWDTSNVTDMKYMFSRALLFNQNISNWNTGKVTTMEGMFNNAPFFNQPIGNWNTSFVTSIASMFESTYFNQSIANWDTSKVTTLYKIFYNNSIFNQNISNWNTGKVTTMAASFYTAYAFNQPIGNWNTSSLWDLRGAFQSATSFNQNLTGWDTSKVTNMSVLFSGATSFNGNISNWDTSNVNNISSIFQNNYIFNQDLGDWNVSSVTHMIKSFDTVNFSKDNYDSILNGWADDVVQGYINVSFFGSQYSYIGEVGRNILTGTYNWTITDGGNWNKILVSNFSNSIGVINDYFYGVHLAGQEMTMFNIDINDNGNVYEEEKSNSTWNKNAFYNSGMKTFRIGICIEYGFENGIFSSNDYSNCNANERKNLILWAHENGYKVILVAAYVPLWLADNQSWCKYTTTPRGYTTCAPNNYTRWGQLVTDYLDAVDCDLYPETCLVEVWNEPDLDNFWLEGLAETHANKTLEYNKLYNATWYAVKAKYPLVKVGGPAVSDLTMARSQLIYKNWLGNFSNQSDFFSFHEYWDDIVNSDTRPDLWYKTNFYYVFNNLTYYGSNITEVYLDEWNMRNAALQYNPSLYNIYAGKVALSYMGALNGYPSNLSMHFFQWTSPYHNGTMQTKEESYDWRMVAEPNLLNAGESSYKAPYNVTSAFAHLCPAGGNVWQHENDGECVQWTACSKGNMFSLIGSNSCNYSQNYTANLSLTNGSVFYPYNKIQNYETGALLNVGTDGIVQLGVLDSYETLYLYSATSDTKLLSNRFKLDEYNGNTIYDSLQNLSNGVKSGATWVNDGILVALTNLVDYTIDLGNGLISIINSDYLYEYLFIDYNYNKIFGFHVSILNVIAGFLMIVVLGVAIIYVVKYFKNIKELE